MENKFLNAYNRKVQKVPPIWFMRQAGRYHSHYQNLRKDYSFIELCKIPEIACEVTLGPINEFDFDLAIIFSDILFPLMAIGVDVEYSEKGVLLNNVITNNNINNIEKWEDLIEYMNFQKTALQITKQNLSKEKALLGFIGGIWTLFLYGTGFVKVDNFDYKSYGELLNKFSLKILPFLKANIALQLEGGADVVMIFDSSAGDVDSEFYKKYLEPHLLELAKTFPNKLGYYSKGITSNHISNDLLNANWAGLGFDENIDIKSMFKKRKTGFIQGNFNNKHMLLPKNEMLELLKEYLNDFKSIGLDERSAWVCGLSHGILPKTPEENVHAFINTVRETFS